MAQPKPSTPIICDTLRNLTTPQLTLTMPQCSHCFTMCPSDNSLACHLKQYPNSHNRLQQVLQALNPSQSDPFAPSNFDKDTMDFIPASSPNHVPLFVEERTQLDFIRVLGKACVSLQIQDKIIDWACYYSLVNTLYNGGGDFWIHHTFPGRGHFLNDLAGKVGTTNHRSHICNVVKGGVTCPSDNSLAHHIGRQAAVPQPNGSGSSPRMHFPFLGFRFCLSKK